MREWLASIQSPAAFIAACAALVGAVLTFIGNRSARRRQSADRRLEILLARYEAVIARQDTEITELRARLRVHPDDRR